MLNQYSLRTYFNESFGIDSADNVDKVAINAALQGIPAGRDIAIYSLESGDIVAHVDTYAAAWDMVARNSGLFFYE